MEREGGGKGGENGSGGGDEVKKIILGVAGKSLSKE